MSLYFIPTAFLQINPVVAAMILITHTLNYVFLTLLKTWIYTSNLKQELMNLISKTNKTLYVSWHETCTWKCRLDVQRWNSDKCRCECKELLDKGKCDDRLIWNPSTCECDCDKSYEVGEYLDYVSCKCRKKLIDSLVEKCNENIDGNEIIYKATLYNYEKVCISCTRYIIINHSGCINNYGYHWCVFLFLFGCKKKLGQFSISLIAY